MPGPIPSPMARSGPETYPDIVSRKISWSRPGSSSRPLLECRRGKRMKITALIAWVGLRGIWTEWVLALYEWPFAFRSGRPVPECTHAVTLRSRCVCGADRRWRTSAGKSLRAAGACTSWACDREHFLLSSPHRSEWSDHRNCCRYPVGSRRLSSPPILIRHIRATGFISKPEPPRVPFVIQLREARGWKLTARYKKRNQGRACIAFGIILTTSHVRASVYLFGRKEG